MLTRPQVQRYSAEAGLRDIRIAETEIVLTYLLQLMAQEGILDRLAFKGGTCLRKMFIGGGGRFSTDLDFTRIEEHDHEDMILAMMEAFERPFHGVRFSIPDGSYYETQDGLSWGVNPVYTHHWNPDGQSEIKIQVSRRELPTLPPSRLAQSPQSYFRQLSFEPVSIASCSRSGDSATLGGCSGLLKALAPGRVHRPGQPGGGVRRRLAGGGAGAEVFVQPVAQVDPVAFADPPPRCAPAAIRAACATAPHDRIAGPDDGDRA